MEIVDVEHPDIEYVEYSRSDAIKDGYLLKSEVTFYDAEDVTWLSRTGAQVTVPSLANADEEHIRPGIYTAIRTSSADEIIFKAIAEFEQWLLVQPTAKMIIMTASISEAERIAKLLASDQRSAHINRTLATSDDSKADKNLKTFRTTGHYKILVSVRQCCEGYDVPATSHLVILSPYRSKTWVEQAVGRAIRVDTTLPDDMPQKAFIYCLDEMLMREVMEAIRGEEDAITVDKKLGDDESRLGITGSSNEIVAIASRIGEQTAIDLESGASLSMIAIRQAAQTSGVVASDLQLQEMANALRKRSGEIVPIQVSITDQENALRRRIEGRVREIAAKTEKSPRDLNSAIKKHYSNTPRSQMSLDQLKQVWRELTTWCQEKL